MNLSLANYSDEPDLRQTLANFPMPGWVQIAYLREPDFFLASKIQGTKVQTIVGHNGDQFLGFGSRALKPMYINGRPQQFGYLSSLRALPEGRAYRALFRAHRYLHELHRDGETPAYLATILEDNALARRVLTSGKAGLPTYQDFGEYITYAININGFFGGRSKRFTIRSAQPDDLGAVLGFYAEYGRHYQFYPVLKKDMFNSDYLRGLDITDWLLASSGEDLVGVMAIWDQSAYRQLRVIGYRRPLAIGRSFVNLGLRTCGFSPLPERGQDLQTRFGAFICTASEDPSILHELLTAAQHKLKNCGVNYLTFGLHERDSRREAVKGFLRFEYRSKLYLVHWDDGELFCGDLQERTPFLEAGSL